MQTIDQLPPEGNVPASTKAEFHLTYRCSLGCPACSRACFAKAHTPDMTLEDAEEFFRQADALQWKPRIILIGGEPTLNPDFEQFVRIASAWSGTYVQVYSNGYGTAAPLLEKVCSEQNASICRDGEKLAGRVSGNEAWWDRFVFVSPVDAMVSVRDKCFIHSSWICGVGIDHEGYSLCPVGLTMAAHVAPQARTKRLADLFDPLLAKTMTDEMCRHCGHHYSERLRPGYPAERCLPHSQSVERSRRSEFYRFAAYGDSEEVELFGETPASPLWMKAFRRNRASDK
jgi:hypothetical protein